MLSSAFLIIAPFSSDTITSFIAIVIPDLDAYLNPISLILSSISGVLSCPKASEQAEVISFNTGLSISVL